MHFQEVTDTFSLEQVVPFFQPIMDLSHDAVCRYECLARLVTPSQQTFHPTDVLQLAERQNAVSHLSETMLLRSAAYFRHRNIGWNINICAADMHNDGLLALARERLADYPVSTQVGFEITAAAILADPKAFEAFLQRCKQQGVAVFVDHFDAEQSDLLTLLDYPVDGVKLSGELIKQMPQSEEAFETVRTLNEKGCQSGIVMIAEHVESEETLRLAREAGLSWAQGFYFCQPSPTHHC